MLVKDVVQKTTAFFREKGIESARLDAEILISRSLKWRRVDLYVKFDYPMSEPELAAAREWVRRRAQGEPVAYIVGERDFYDSTFLVSPGVLVPRPETEGLVEAALAFARARGAVPAPFRAVDLGCGTGCVGLSVAKALAKAGTEARILAVDVSEAAERATLLNKQNLNIGEGAVVLLRDVLGLTRAEVEGALGGPADCVLANPPYVDERDPLLSPDVRRHEPALALFSGESGLAHIRTWAAKAVEITGPGALVAFEIGSTQASEARATFRAQPGLVDVTVHKDLAGLDRFIHAIRA